MCDYFRGDGSYSFYVDKNICYRETNDPTYCFMNGGYLEKMREFVFLHYKIRLSSE